jgi:hypothetical protein
MILGIHVKIALEALRSGPNLRHNCQNDADPNQRVKENEANFAIYRLGIVPSVALMMGWVPVQHGKPIVSKLASKHAKRTINKPLELFMLFKEILKKNCQSKCWEAFVYMASIFKTLLHLN